MLRILNVVGARPQIIKAAAITRTIKNNFQKEISEMILHTGQHYDHEMSQVFFEEMDIPKPDFNLDVGSASHAVQTAKILQGAENILSHEKPSCVIVYGDTNSTLAVSLAAVKMQIPVVHIEAGLRSFNKTMPEEINRIVCDHVSTLLFTPTFKGIENLEKEGFRIGQNPPFTKDNPGIFQCGDVMYDNSLYYAHKTKARGNVLDSLELEKEKFILATIHRDMNTDDPEKLGNILRAFLEIVHQYQLKIVFPVHPRTQKMMESIVDRELYDRVQSNQNIILTKPFTFIEMIHLEKECKMVITDSGGVQKEAYFFHKPAIILRKETEWVEIADCGAAKLAGTDFRIILEAVKYYYHKTGIEYPALFGDGKAAEFICKKLVENFS
jgi:UDP-GlcNAc3NAcA epimerase